MFLMKTFCQFVIYLSAAQVICGQSCGPRDTTVTGRHCERACQEDGSCRKENRECVCDGQCGLSCLKKTCPHLDFRSEGSVTVIPFQRYIGSVATYSCNRGFTLLGNTNRTCQSDKTWSGSEPVCHADTFSRSPRLTSPNLCNFITFPANGIVGYYGENLIEGVVATYRCDEGFTLRGNQNRTCQRDGSWSGTEPVCVRDSCPETLSIINGFVHYDEEINDVTEEGSRISFSCFEGFQLRVPQHITCRNGQWSDFFPHCVVTCPSFKDPPNGQKIGTDISYNSEISFRCDVGYILEGNEEVRCLADGSWSGTPPTCREVRCAAPGSPENGTSDGDLMEYSYLDNITFSCDIGFILRGSKIVTCNVNEEWSDSVPICQQIKCPAPLVPDHGSSDPDRAEYPYKSKVTFNCNPDYTLRGSRETRCNLNGTWTSPPPKCRASCVVPSQPRNGEWEEGVVEESRQRHGFRLNYACNSGFIKCQVSPLKCVDGSWIPPEPVLCLRGCQMENPQSLELSASYRHPNNVSCVHETVKPVGTVRSFTCSRGYRFPVGVPRKSTCVRRSFRQEWSSPQPKCEKILCPDIHFPNGRVLYSLNESTTSILEQNTTASFECNSGYEKSHVNSTSCDVGVWTNEIPDCIEEPCSVSSIVIGNWEVEFDTTESESASGYRRAGTNATFNCYEYGYFTREKHTCRKGRWKGKRPSCQRIPCRDESLKNGRLEYIPDRVLHGSVRIYKCRQGFTLRGSPSSYCDAGRWTNDLPDCIEDPCREDSLVSGGWPLNFTSPSQEDGFRPGGTVATLACPRGYHMSGEQICHTGTWRGSELSCSIIQCQHERLKHGRVRYKPPRPEHGTLRTFQCSQGYHFLSPPDESRCDVGEWTAELPLCVEG